MNKLQSNPAHIAEFGLFDGILSAFQSVGAGIGRVLKLLQTARMMQALSEMNDMQLAEIGITRSEIPAYATQLMSGDMATEDGIAAKA